MKVFAIGKIILGKVSESDKKPFKVCFFFKEVRILSVAMHLP